MILTILDEGIPYIPVADLNEIAGVIEDKFGSAAKTICGSLRETDVPAYTGDGIFAVMFVELGKKNAENIISRLIETIRKNAGPQLGTQAKIEYKYNTWTGKSYADIDALNELLLVYNKKI